MAAELLPLIIGLSLAAAYMQNHILRFGLLIIIDSACAGLMALSGVQAPSIVFFIITGFVMNTVIIILAPLDKMSFSPREIPAALMAAAAIAAISAAAASARAASIKPITAAPTVIFICFCMLFTAGYFIIKESAARKND